MKNRPARLSPVEKMHVQAERKAWALLMGELSDADRERIMKARQELYDAQFRLRMLLASVASPSTPIKEDV